MVILLNFFDNLYIINLINILFQFTVFEFDLNFTANKYHYTKRESNLGKKIVARVIQLGVDDDKPIDKTITSKIKIEKDCFVFHIVQTHLKTPIKLIANANYIIGMHNLFIKNITI